MDNRRALRVAVIVSLLAATFVLLVSEPGYTEGPLSGKSICLDPGHGGADPGAVNAAYSLHEADINLDVAYGLKALLEGSGATVEMTRTDDRYLTNSDRYTFCNSVAADILVSVHTNSVLETWVDGSYALYFHSDDKVLAQTIYDVMYPALRDSAPDPDSFTSFGLNRYASGVLLKSDMPAAMMEPLFMSNPTEAALLATPIYTEASTTPNLTCRRGQIAQAIYDGILSYFGPGSTNAPPTASFTYTCNALTCEFNASSSSDDESIVSYAWDFGDEETGSGVTTSHTYAAAGTYAVTLTVTDDEGATDSATQDATVGGGNGFVLTVTGYKVKGLQKADLAWSGATSTKVDVYRDGTVVATPSNDGAYTDNIDQRRGGSYTYQVCEAGTNTCSNEATVTY